MTTPSADNSSSRDACPHCGGASRRTRWKRGEAPFFTIRGPRRCDSCACVFVPPAGVGLSLGTVAFALCFGLLLIPSAGEVFRDLRDGRILGGLVNLTLLVVTLPWLCVIGWMGFTQLRAALRSRADQAMLGTEELR